MEIKQQIMMCINILYNIHTPRKSLTFLGCSSSLSSSQVTQELQVLYCIGKLFFGILVPQVFLRPYAGPIQVLFMSYLGCIQVFYRYYLGPPKVFFRFQLDIHKKFDRLQLYLSQILYLNYSVAFRSFLGAFQVFFRFYLGLTKVFFRSQVYLSQICERNSKDSS